LLPIEKKSLSILAVGKAFLYNGRIIFSPAEEEKKWEYPDIYFSVRDIESPKASIEELREMADFLHNFSDSLSKISTAPPSAPELKKIISEEYFLLKNFKNIDRNHVLYTLEQSVIVLAKIIEKKYQSSEEDAPKGIAWENYVYFTPEIIK
jgi:hypothetical protein